MTQSTTAPVTKEIRDLHIGDKFFHYGEWCNTLMKTVHGKHTRVTLMYKDGEVVSVALPSTRWVKTKREW